MPVRKGMKTCTGCAEVAGGHGEAAHTAATGVETSVVLHCGTICTPAAP